MTMESKLSLFPGIVVRSILIVITSVIVIVFDLSTLCAQSLSLEAGSSSTLKKQSELQWRDLPTVCTAELPNAWKIPQVGATITQAGGQTAQPQDSHRELPNGIDRELMDHEQAIRLAQWLQTGESTTTADDGNQAGVQRVDAVVNYLSQAAMPQNAGQGGMLPANGNPHAGGSDNARQIWQPSQPGEDPHAAVFANTPFPSALECATCHQQIYDEWASSSHAYASISPMFHAFENTINRLAQGTVGYFCLRCHAPVATTVGLRRDQPIWDGPLVFREGVTCVACHRVKTPYVKANGERRIEPGDLSAPVYGSGDGQGVELAIKYRDFFKTKLHANENLPGQVIHRQAIQFEELQQSTFCMSCHQVAVQPGIKLEVVWEQYRASPACREGVSCQDCHMGKVPGVNAGYAVGPAAVINDKVVNPERRHSNHMFYGPGYSIAHPGVFPHTKEALRWQFNDWQQFDWRAGWGTESFEDAVAEGRQRAWFPPVWNNPDDRYDARDIVDKNLKKLQYKADVRRQVLENGSKVDGPFFLDEPRLGAPLKLYYCVTNLNPGHNMPSGSLGAQPQIWLNVVLIGPDGNWLWESGYLDSQGDLADLHSEDVLKHRLPHDKQLFNLQTKFLTTNVKGTDREMYLPVNFDFDQLPFFRPAPQPVTVINHPPFIRMEGHSLPPLGSRKAKYVVPAELLQQPGTYRLSVRLRSRAEPNYFMRFCNATPEMIRMMDEWLVNFHVQSVIFEVVE